METPTKTDNPSLVVFFLFLVYCLLFIIIVQQILSEFGTLIQPNIIMDFTVITLIVVVVIVLLV